MNTVYDFEAQQEQWSRPPVDDVGYMPSDLLLQMADDELRGLIESMAHVRYTGWRNHGNLWHHCTDYPRISTNLVQELSEARFNPTRLSLETR